MSTARKPPKWVTNPPTWLYVVSWLGLVGCVAGALVNLPPAVRDLGDLMAYRGDPSCTAQLGDASRPSGSCSVSSAKFETAGFEDSTQVVYYGRGATTVRNEHYYISVQLPDGTKRTVDTGKAIYDGSLVQLGFEKFYAQVYKGGITRLAVDTTESDTSDHPSWRFGDDVVKPMVFTLFGSLFGLWVFRATRGRTAAAS